MKITILQLRSFYIEKKRSLGYTVMLDGIMTDQDIIKCPVMIFKIRYEGSNSNEGIETRTEIRGGAF